MSATLTHNINTLADQIEYNIVLNENTAQSILTVLREIAELSRREDSVSTEKAENDLREVRALMESNEKYVKGFNIQSEELKKMSERLETAQGEADLAYQLEDFIQGWCNDNDCEPEDIQSLAHTVVEDHLHDLFAELAEKSPEDWGKKRDWSVDVRVTFTGTVTVSAVSEDAAKDAVREKFQDCDVDLDDLSYDDLDVEDVNED